MKLAGASWSYCENGFGPDRWHKRYVGSEGELQSPINIEKDNVIEDTDLKSLMFSYEPTTNCTLTNDGRTLQVAMSNRGHKNVLCGGPLMHCYQLAMIRFHWSNDDTLGSEHQVDGEHYPLEVQLLHWNKDLYKNVGQALTGEHGICIVAVLFQAGDEEHEALKDIIKLLSREDHKGCFSSEMKSPINPSDFIPGCGKYWTYQGSLTTPPLTENVSWIVYQAPESLSLKQMEVFRRIRTTNGDLMIRNSRPVCPSNNRAIRESSDKATGQANCETIGNHDDADVNGNHDDTDVPDNLEETESYDDTDVNGNHGDADVVSNHGDSDDANDFETANNYQENESN